MTDSTGVLDADGIVDIPDAELERLTAEGYPAEVLPLAKSGRTWKTRDYITVWMGPVHNLLSYFTVVGFFALGLSAWQVVGAIMISAVIVSAGYVLNGVSAARYGVPFAMLLRDVFGIKGAVIPAYVRGLVAGFVFFGLTTTSTAQALDVVFEQIWPGYRNFAGRAEFLGLPIPTLISFLIMLTITIALYLGGQKFLGKFSNWSSPAVYVLAVIAVVLALVNAGGFQKAFEFHPVDTPVTPIIFIACVSALVSNWAGPIVNISDYSRNAKAARYPAIGFPVGMIVSYILFAVVTVSFMASLNATTGGKFDINNPAVFVDAIGSIGNPFVIVLLILAFNTGATAFCVFGNMLPSGLQLTASLPKVFTVKTGGLVAAALGTLMLPWLFVKSTGILFLFYGFIGSMFGPIAGLMLAHFFFTRRGRLRLEDMYTAAGSHGLYRRGINTKAVVILIVSFVVTMAGAFTPEIAWLHTINQFAFFVGLIIGFVGYLVAGGAQTQTGKES
ncbi:cytosine permease [Microbacterium sp. ASV49]|uniref:Cytosine permease n=1 Tax=Microbacterium candidum TaxID=3041922 RepID=A0ABT7N1J5_9MICO|nr:cytosine permease [Microbacterium sp. ASV49]MDL9980584.1 cytosine permease [Microbacterium sp. ASV49]